MRGLGLGLGMKLGGVEPAAPAQLNPATVFDIALWAGSGAARDIVTDFDMGKSMLWIKSRSSTAQGVIFDTARGANAYWSPTSTAASATLSNSMTEFKENGYSLGTQANVNAVGVNYVGWAFKKQPKFFDVVKWTGSGVQREIAHELGCEPGLIIVKRRDSGGSGAVYHRKSGANPGAQYTLINNTGAVTVNNTTFGGVAATSTHFTVGDSATVNAAAATYVAYLFAHDPAGIIGCDSYVGNGLSAGPVVNLGWRPQFLYIKRIDGISNHMMLDTARGVVTGTGDSQMMANLTDAETTGDFVDFTDTGFQIKATTQSYNTAASVYTYMAIKA